jgi:hypothetical protein
MSPRTEGAHLGLNATHLSQIVGIVGQRFGLSPEAFGPATGRGLGQRLPDDRTAVRAVGGQFPQRGIRTFVAPKRNRCHRQSVTRGHLKTESQSV